MPVIGRGAPEFLESRPCLLKSPYVSFPLACVFASLFAQLFYILAEIGEISIDNRIRAEGRDDACFPFRIADEAVVVQRVDGRIRSCQDLNVKAFVKSAGQELRCTQLLRDGIKDDVGCLRR